MKRKKIKAIRPIKVLVGVKDGVAFGIKVPKGIIVELHDYDVEGSEPERLLKDKDGDEYVKDVL